MNLERGNCLRLLSVSWPRPVRHNGTAWTSDPEWDSPVMPHLPQWRLRMFDGEAFHVIDWRETFSSDLTAAGRPAAGEMRGFHVVCRFRVEHGGRLIFVDTDGCIIRRNGKVVHEDREQHPLRRHELPVAIGDRLEVAQWQQIGDWFWGVRLNFCPTDESNDYTLLKPYWRKIDAALRNPNGPVLKMFTAASDPLRCAVCIYSLVLNGYRPAGIQIYGEHQWNAARRHALRTLLPFAEIVPTRLVEQTIRRLDSRLPMLARRRWPILKTCVCLFMPPYECCHLDDDVFVLDRVDDALAAFASHDLVYQSDDDYEREYRDFWCPERTSPLPTGRLNAGFYFVRNTTALVDQANRLSCGDPARRVRSWVWEQGFLAWEFADAATHELPSQRYFYPVFDGLPGGVLGYDWHKNPCGFATVHFGGPRPKPSEREVAALVHDILGRLTAT